MTHKMEKNKEKQNLRFESTFGTYEIEKNRNACKAEIETFRRCLVCL